MTTPVSPAPPAARPAPAADSGGSDSAEPFASALDGALDAGRAAVDGAGAEAGGDPAADQDDAAPADPAAAGADAAPAPAPGGAVAALWTLLTGATKAPDAPAGDATPAAGAVLAAGAGLPPGLAVAERLGGRAVAHGARGEAPGQLPTATAPAAPAVPGTPATPPPAGAAAKAAVEALAAAGVTQLVTESAPAGDAVPPAAVPTAPATPSTGAAVAPAPAAPQQALPGEAPPAAGSGTPDPGPDGGATREQAAPAADAVPTSGPSAPAPAATAVTRPEASTGAAVAHPVSDQIARSVAVLRGAPDGSHTMTVVLTPDNLGPVEVAVTVSKGAIELTLRGAHEHGRAALLDAVPDLRRDLEAAGLTCSRLDVDRGRDGGFSSSLSSHQGGRFGDPGGGRGSGPDRGDGGARPWHRSADRGDGPRATTRTATGLDVRV